MAGEANGNALTGSLSPWWAKLLDRFGIPTVMLGVVLWFGYQGLVWLSQNVFVPVTNGHVELLKSVRESTAEMSTQAKLQTQTLKTIAESNNGILEVVKNNQQLNREMIKSISDAMDEVRVDHATQHKILEQLQNGKQLPD